MGTNQGCLAVRSVRSAGEGDVFDAPAGGEFSQRVALVAIFSDAADVAVLGVHFVVGPRLVGGDDDVSAFRSRRGDDVELVGRAALQVEAAGDEVFGFGPLEAESVGAEGVG